MKEIYTNARTCVYHINYHIVWCVKYRKPVLTEEVQKELINKLYEIAHDKGFIIHECAVGNDDHVHVFVSAHPKIAPSYIVKMMKGITGRYLFMKYPFIGKKLYNGTIWNHSFFIETIGSTSKENIQKYIRQQAEVKKIK